MAAASQQQTQGMAGPRRLLAWVALFLVVAGVRLWLVASFGSAVPLLDQWDDEGAGIYKPYLEGDLGLDEIVAVHNEHRPVVARMVALGLLTLNGQWDARVQMAVNALIAAAVALVIAWVGVRVVAERHRTLVLVAAALWSSIPYAWENTTWAFQSSFYFLVGFSVLAVWGLLAHHPFTRAWTCGVVAAFLACFSMGSGFLCGAAVLGMLALRVATRRAPLSNCAATAAFCIATIALGLTLRVHVPDHDVLRAASALQWLNVFTRGLAAPFMQTPAACLLICLPAALLAIAYFRREGAFRTSESATRAEMVLGLTVFVALQSAAIALTRGGGIYSGWMSSRYIDVLALGTMTNFLAILVLTSIWRMPPTWRAAVTVSVAVWVAAAVAGAALLGQRGFADMRARAEQVRRAEANVRAYLHDGEIGRLSAGATDAVYPWSDRLGIWLSDPTIRAILPVTIRLPLQIEAEGNSAAFRPSDEPNVGRIWSSADGGGEMRTHLFRPTLPLVRLAMREGLSDRISLKFRDEATGRETRAKFAGARAGWRSGYAKVSRETRIIARDHDPARALAFTEPTEVGWLSYYVEQLLARGVHVLVGGLAIAAALAVTGAVHLKGS